jgi:putative ABC transport system permease protein
VESLRRNLRVGIRLLTKNPGFTLPIVLILAIGTSASSAIFSVVYSILLHPLPYPNSENLVMIWGTEQQDPRAKSAASYQDLRDWRSQSKSFERIEAFDWKYLVLTGRGEPERLSGMMVSGEFFQMIGVTPTLGRLFTKGDEETGAQVAIISHELWKRRFSLSEKVIEERILIDGEGYTVIGVMPQGLDETFISWPDSQFAAPQIWLPSKLTVQEKAERDARVQYAIGRLKGQADLVKARVEMDTIARRLADQYPETNKNIGVSLVQLRQEMVGDVKPVLLVLVGAIGALLLIVYANVAILLLAQATRRRTEMGVRVALGASLRQLIVQLLTENLLLSGVSCAIGLLITYIGIKPLILIGPQDLPRLNEIDVNWKVLAFTALIGVITSVIFGLLSSYQAFRTDLARVLGQSVGNAKSDKFTHRMREFLIIFELSAAMLLLVGATLMTRSFIQLQKINPGINYENVLTMRLVLAPDKYEESNKRTAFFSQLLQNVNALPGVKSAVLARSIPFGSGNTKVIAKIKGRQPPSGKGWPPVDYNTISEDFYQTMGISLRHGRPFSKLDNETSNKVAVINEAMAQRYWPGESPLGQRLTLSMPGVTIEDLEIIGVTSNIRQRGLDEDVQPCLFVSYRQFPERTQMMYLLARTSSSPLNLISNLRSEVWSIDKDQPVSEIGALEQLVSKSVAVRRFNMVLLQLLSGIAFFLALSGVYGLMAYIVSQRTREVAIRMALGAQPSDVLKLFMGQFLIKIIVGIFIGVMASLGATALIKKSLFGVTPTDPLTFVITTALLMVAAIIATFIPIRRAIKVSPATSMRIE